MQFCVFFAECGNGLRLGESIVTNWEIQSKIFNVGFAQRFQSISLSNAIAEIPARR